ncbi:hypothetical protein SLEP1_g54699 [Rubroshorea leprosula]|uniref:Uncharacterized protein n=1 Tax=Rubroshorea leprosula TaxID=152421 RepID=A0AAV5MDI2_9ROSI|nr:hypothetical protein SLEP1_g54699 [Rubroshorea leprosula]
MKFSSKSNHFPCRVVLNCFNPSIFGGIYNSRLRRPGIVGSRAHLRSLSEENNDLGGDQGEVLVGLDLKSLKIFLKQGVFIWPTLCCLLVFECKRVLATEGVVNAGYEVVVNGRDFYNYTVAMEGLLSLSCDFGFSPSLPLGHLLLATSSSHPNGSNLPSVR